MYRRIPLSIETGKVLKLLVCTLCIMLFAVSCYYFIKTTDTAEMGYQFKENQIRQNNLRSENRILQQQVLDEQSLSKLQTSPAVAKLQQPEKSIYVEPKGPLTKRNSKNPDPIF